MTRPTLQTLEHQFIGIDEGRQQLWRIDTRHADAGWQVDLAAYPQARDLQHLGDERVLVGYDHGFMEVDIATGQILRLCDEWTQVSAVTRQPDGSTLVTGCDLDGRGGVTTLTLDSALAVRHVARREGDYVRLMRTTPEGTYLLCTNDHILETRADLTTIRELRADGFLHAWKAERLANGTTLVSAGYGAFMALFDAAGHLCKTFGGAAQTPAAVAPHFYASFQVLPNGNMVVANWQGHGPDNGNKGQQLLEFSAEGQLRGTWSDAAKLSSLQGLLVL